MVFEDNHTKKSPLLDPLLLLGWVVLVILTGLAVFLTKDARQNALFPVPAGTTAIFELTNAGEIDQTMYPPIKDAQLSLKDSTGLGAEELWSIFKIKKMFILSGEQENRPFFIIYWTESSPVDTELLLKWLFSRLYPKRKAIELSDGTSSFLLLADQNFQQNKFFYEKQGKWNSLSTIQGVQ